MNMIGVYPVGKIPKKKIDLAYNIIDFCISKLIPRMNTLDIVVMLSDDMDDFNEDGFCLAQTNRQFEIDINGKLKGDDFITAICHEMAHVKQFAKGELAIDGKVNYSSIEEYLDLWYEKEAYELQEILCSEFKSLKTKTKKV
jgi:hypothetical protein